MATTTTRKTTTRKTASSKPVPTPAQALRAAGVGAASAASAPDASDKLRKKVFVERVVAASGMRKRDVKPIVEAALAELGKALDEGKQLVLPELGNVRIANSKPTAKGTVHTVKVRRAGPAKDAVAKESDAG